VATPIWDKAGTDIEQVTIPAEFEQQYGRCARGDGQDGQGSCGARHPARARGETIERALTARRMKARYLVGPEARAMLLARRLLPDLVFDRVAQRVLRV